MKNEIRIDMFVRAFLFRQISTSVKNHSPARTANAEITGSSIVLAATRPDANAIPGKSAG